eukprot:Ihof_evm1s601 gene=Ihof_evmTU1s601
MALSTGKPVAELLFDNEGEMDETSLSQIAVERDVAAVFDSLKSPSDFQRRVQLKRDAHIRYLTRGLDSLSGSFVCLDASRPWLVYWMVHSLSLLGHSVKPAQSERIVRFLGRCQDPAGGFGGGPQQAAHLAATYAAINALCVIGTESAYNVIDRTALVSFLQAVRQPDGSFRMEEEGETDVRGCYCAVSVAVLCGLPIDQLFDGTAEWIASCQTYEGGFGSEPMVEAHGGYTFCGVAALILLGRTDLLDLDALIYWATNRQMRFEGGFQGRTNKLVDACYSFWQGGIFPLIDHISRERGLSSVIPDKDYVYSRVALQQYILLVCQNSQGGFFDKPGKSVDFYHTCYALSGLSSAQHHMILDQSTASSTLVVGDVDDVL